MAELLLRADSANCNGASGVNPATFLDYFTALGGGYWLTPDGKLWLGVLQTDANEPDRKLAAQLMRHIGPDDAERIKAHLTIADQPRDPVTEFLASERAVNEGKICDEEYIATLYSLDDWQPPTERDFVRKYLAMFDEDGAPTDDRIAKLTGHALNLCRTA